MSTVWHVNTRLFIDRSVVLGVNFAMSSSGPLGSKNAPQKRGLPALFPLLPRSCMAGEVRNGLLRVFNGCLNDLTGIFVHLVRRQF